MQIRMAVSETGQKEREEKDSDWEKNDDDVVIQEQNEFQDIIMFIVQDLSNELGKPLVTMVRASDIVMMSPLVLVLTLVGF